MSWVVVRQAELREVRSRVKGGRRLEVEVALHQFAEFVAVFIFHVHEFDAVSFQADIADHGREMNFAKAGTNLELDGITDVEFLGRLEIRATETDGFYAREPRMCSFNLRAKRRFERNASVAARYDEAGIRIAGWGECGARGCGASLEASERIF